MSQHEVWKLIWCVCVCVRSSDGATQHWLVGPNVGGPAAAAGGGRSGGGGGRHRAQHAAAETQEQHLVSDVTMTTDLYQEQAAR